MSNKTRFIIALVITGLLAALATPEINKYLPEGLPTILAVAFSAILHRMNAEAPAPLPAPPEYPAKLTALPGGKDEDK